MTLLEPDVSLTDLGIAIEASFLAYLMRRRSVKSSLRTDSILFFVMLAIASLLGAVAHGVFYPGTVTNEVLFQLTLVSLGVIAYAEWLIAADLLLPTRRRLVQALAAIALVLYAAYILLVSHDFRVAMVNYFVPTLALLIACTLLLLRMRQVRIGLGVLGILLTFLAAWVQQSQITIHPRYLTHNALFHVIQAVALALLFVALRAFVQKSPPRAVSDVGRPPG